MPDLVIVESPAKAKTIRKPGKGYTVRLGRPCQDLRPNVSGVDLQDGFTPEYNVHSRQGQGPR